MVSIGTMIVGFTGTMSIHFHREEKELEKKRLLKLMYTCFNYELLKYSSTNKSTILKTYEKFKLFRDTIVDDIIMHAISPRIMNPVQ